MKKVVAKKGQTAYDLAIQYCGAVEAAYDILKMNSVSDDDDLEGMTLLVPDMVDEKVVLKLQEMGVSPATRYLEELKAGRYIEVASIPAQYNVVDAAGFESAIALLAKNGSIIFWQPSSGFAVQGNAGSGGLQYTNIYVYTGVNRRYVYLVRQTVLYDWELILVKETWNGADYISNSNKRIAMTKYNDELIAVVGGLPRFIAEINGGGGYGLPKDEYYSFVGMDGESSDSLVLGNTSGYNFESQKTVEFPGIVPGLSGAFTCWLQMGDGVEYVVYNNRLYSRRGTQMEWSLHTETMHEQVYHIKRKGTELHVVTSKGVLNQYGRILYAGNPVTLEMIEEDGVYCGALKVPKHITAMGKEYLIRGNKILQYIAQ